MSLRWGRTWRWLARCAFSSTSYPCHSVSCSRERRRLREGVIVIRRNRMKNKTVTLMLICTDARKLRNRNSITTLLKCMQLLAASWTKHQCRMPTISNGLKSLTGVYGPTSFWHASRAWCVLTLWALLALESHFCQSTNRFDTEDVYSELCWRCC